jgi:uroporphyrinogen decarboxylase
MTKREDFFAAMHQMQPSGRVPLWELEFHIWDKVSGKHLLVGPEFAELTRTGKERAVYTNADIFIEVSERLGFSAVTLPSQWWEISPGVPAYYWMPEDWRIEQTRVLRNLAPELILVQNCSALLGIPMGADYIPFAYKLFDAPGEIQELAERKLKEGLEASARFFDLGVEVGLSTTDLADNHSTFMSPKQLERFVWPYLDKWADSLRSMGMISILHSDGNLNACIDTIADSGVNCLQALDPTAGMDMHKVKERVNGKICLSGNVSVSLLVGGTPDDVFEATKNILENCKTGGALALGASNAVQTSVPLENYLALIDAWGSFGGYDESLRTK